MPTAENVAADPVAWDVAERVARRLINEPAVMDETTRRRLDEDFAEATTEAEGLVEQATGLHPQSGPARARVIDRAGWAAVNVKSFQRLTQPLSERLANEAHGSSRLAGLGGASKSAAGVEVGVLLSWLSTKVLGQYDLLPVDEDDAGDCVYYVGPNIVSVERRNAFAPHEFRLWIALHELTHRFQFTGVPWMRDYFFQLVDRAFSLATPDGHTVLESLQRVFAEVREGRNPLLENGLAGLIATPEHMELMREAQALMSLLEGHSNFVMARAGAGRVHGADRFGRVLAERRAKARGAVKFVQQLLGFEAKLRQYVEGESFVEHVVRVGGEEMFSRVWQAPEMLPTIDEIRAPQHWIDRVGGLSSALA